MNPKIAELRARLIAQVGSAVTAGNVSAITRWSACLARLEDIAVADERIAAQIAEIEREITPPPGQVIAPHSKTEHRELDDAVARLRTAGRKQPTTLKIEIDWSHNGQPFGRETICEPLASDTLAALLDRLLEIRGPKVVEVASQLRVNRGPFISKNPRADYWNASANEVYAYREWKDGYVILTNTETSQKVDDVNALLKALRFVPGSYSVTQITRSEGKLLVA
jgi:hypothetical protein